jgi:hypothetical protein
MKGLPDRIYVFWVRELVVGVCNLRRGRSEKHKYPSHSFSFSFFLVFPMAEANKIRLQRNLGNNPFYIPSPGSTK